MRTTIRLDDELLREAKRYALEHDLSLTAVIDRALRTELALAAAEPTAPRRFRIRPSRGGALLPGVDLDDNARLRDEMERAGR